MFAGQLSPTDKTLISLSGLNRRVNRLSASFFPCKSIDVAQPRCICLILTSCHSFTVLEPYYDMRPCSSPSLVVTQTPSAGT